MNFGEKLKQLRNEAGLTQPQLADRAGIEQSYLSKLENERSVPSGEVLNQLLKVLSSDVQQFLQGMDARSQQKLQSIPEVAQILKQQQISMISNRKQWLLVSVALCVIGTGLFSGGYFKAFFSEQVFDYSSEGVVLPGESKEVFRNWRDGLVGAKLERTSKGMDVNKALELKEQKELEMYQRKDEVFLSFDQYKGTKFVEKADGGSRTFRLKDSRRVSRPQNKWIMVLGVMFFTAGLFGFAVERKVS